MPSDDEDWRLRIDFGAKHDLDVLLARVRDLGAVSADAATSDTNGDGVFTHDGKTFFAYAGSKASLDRARAAIEQGMRATRATGGIVTSRWDQGISEWRQVDPPPTADAGCEVARARSSADADQPEACTTVCDIGKAIRKPFEEQASVFAQNLGLEYSIEEHPHLLSTQVAFTVSGSQKSVSAFVSYLKNEARTSARVGRTAFR